MKTIQSYFDNYKYAVYYNNNKHHHGFEKQLLLSNKPSTEKDQKGKEYICFVSYDYKNQLEKFPKAKSTNPLTFSDKLLIEVEEKIILEDDFQITYTEPTNIQLKITISKEDYIKQVNKLKEHIQAGDIYEINFCISFESENAVINPLYIYNKLNEISLASYSALAKFDSKWIISSSPELYIEKKETKLVTKPIKGTIKRGENKEKDLLLKLQLQQNHKERTENVMIVDVCRNDLSKFAKKGSVLVPKLYAIETYEQVHQMVSTIECQVDENAHTNSMIDATFPMASMTGAPKIKAMELADDYEINNRNAYSGSLGYIKQSGDFTFNVLIRSIFYDEKTKYLSFSVGSAITILSNAEAEYDECLLKAKAMANVLGLKM